PIKTPRWVAERRSVAVGPVRQARRRNVAITSIGQTRQSAAASRQSAAATIERCGGVRGLGGGRRGERTFPSPPGHRLAENRCSKHRSERDSSNERFHGISPSNALTMSGFAHLLSSSNWGENLLPSIESRIGVRGISRCTIKIHPRPFHEAAPPVDDARRTCAS